MMGRRKRWLSFHELRALTMVLANAFAPAWLPPFWRGLAQLPFGLILVTAQSWGALVYVPGRAVAVLTPPRNRPWFIANKVTRLGHTHWRLSNCGAWPTGVGAGTILLTQVCRLADGAQIDICLRASNRDNRRFYQRFGFQQVSSSMRGTTMTRRFQPLRTESAPRSECRDVRLSGRLAIALAH